MAEFLQAEEFTNGTDGEVIFKKDGEAIQVWGALKFKATTSPKTTTRGQIGTRMKLSKITNLENKITLSGDYWLAGLMTEWLSEFKDTGRWPKIDLLAVNEDKGTSMGRMSKLYMDLVPDGEVPLQELDEANETGLTVELTFKFSDWESLSNLKRPVNIGRE